VNGEAIIFGREERRVSMGRYGTVPIEHIKRIVESANRKKKETALVPYHFDPVRTGTGTISLL
jgi:hypothetical protein